MGRADPCHSQFSLLSSVPPLLSRTFSAFRPLLVWLLRKSIEIFMTAASIFHYVIGFSIFFFVAFYFSVGFSRPKWAFCAKIDLGIGCSPRPSFLFMNLNLFCSLRSRQIGLRCNRRKLGFQIRHRFRLMIRMSRL